MIGKKVKDPEIKTRCRKIAQYIAAAKEPGEKLHSLWIAECDTGSAAEDLDPAIREIEATQDLSNRTKKHKTYHLVISFRNEDPIPDVDTLKEIERAYAKALGFEDHQRVVGAHTNTDNFHIHVGYNKIHPKTGTVHTPFRDFKALAKVSMAVEQKYGLATDYDRAPEQGIERPKSADRRPAQGPETDRAPIKVNSPAKDYEAITWEESFESYVKRHKPELTEVLAQSSSWQQFHEGAEDYSLRFKPRGSGLVIENLKGKQRVKASALGREFSKKALEDRLGPYVYPSKSPRKAPRRARERRQYRPRPVTSHPATKRLWRRYMGIQGGKASLGTRAFRTFREFLTAEAIHDPLAMAMIIYQKKLINTLAGLGPQPAALKPKQRKNPVKARKTRLDVPFGDREAAKAQGAKWDRRTKSWYVLGEIPKTMEKWRPAPKPELPDRVSPAKGKDGRER